MPNDTNIQSPYSSQFNIPGAYSTPQFKVEKPEMYRMFNQISSNAKLDSINRERASSIASAQAYLQSQTIRSAEDLNPLKVVDYSTPFSSMYTELNSGEYATRYKSFIPGVNMEEYFAQRQTTGEKWRNGVAKALVNTGTVIAGATIGFFDALSHIPEAISEGSLDPMINSEFAKSLDDLNTKMQNSLPNYYSQDEQNRSLFGQLGTANFYADKFLGGLSFTVGTIVSEGLWAVATGGLSLSKALATSGMNTSRYMKYLATSKDLGKQLIRSAIIPKSGLTGTKRALDWANKVRFLNTSSGFEAGMEARMMMKEAEQNYMTSFMNANGRRPSADELSEFRAENIKAGNGVFLTNMAILGIGNLALYGSLVGLKPFKTGIGASLDKSLFGIGSKEVVKDGQKALEVLTRTKGQKVLGQVYNIGRPIATEGVWEEGGQAITSFTAKDWLEQGYDKKRAKESIGILDNFEKAVAHTYTTKEGQTEILLGSLIGLFAGGFTGQFKMINNKIAVNDFNLRTQNSMGRYSLLNRIQSINRMAATDQKIKDAKDNGDVASEHLAIREQVFNTVLADYKTGELGSSVDKLTDVLDSVSPEEFERATGIKGVDAQNEFKVVLIDEYKKGADRFEKQREHIEAIVGTGRIHGIDPAQFGEGTDITEGFKDALSYHFYMGTEVEKFGGEALENIRAIVAKATGKDVSTKLAIMDALRIASQEKRTAYKALDKKIDSKQKELKALDDVRLTQESLRADPERTREATAKLNEINNQIIKQQGERDKLLDEKVALVRTLGLDNVFADLNDASRDTIMVSDLENIDEDLAYVDELMSSYEKANPKLYTEYQANLREYVRARKAFVRFNETAKAIYNKDFNVRTTNDFISNKFFKKEQGEATLNFIESALKEYMQERNLELANTAFVREKNLSSITVNDEEYEKFKINPKDVSDTTLEKIAQKRSDSEVLVGREKEIYEIHKKAITQKVRAINKTKRVTIKTTTEEEAILEEKAKELTEENLKAKLQDILSKNSFTAAQFYDAETGKYVTPQGLTGVEVREWQLLRAIINSTDAIVDKDQPNRVKPNYYTKKGKAKGVKLSTKQIARYQELSKKLAQYKLLEGTADGGTSMLDLLEALAQLQQNQENRLDREDSETTKITLTPDEVLSINRIAEQDFAGSSSNKSFIQSYDTVKVRVVKGKGKDKKDAFYYQFSHIYVETLINQIAQVKQPVSVVVTQKNGAVHGDLGISNREIGAVYTMTFEDGSSINIKIANKQGNLVIEKSEYDAINPFILIDSGLTKQSYFDVYTTLQNGDLQPLSSDFKIESVNKTDPKREVSIDQIYELEGSRVHLVVSLEDTYNVELEDNFKNGKITEDELTDQLVIYVVSDNKVVGVIKAGDLDNSTEATTNKAKITVAKSESAQIHSAIRQQAKVRFLEAIETTSKEVSLGISMPVKRVYKGTPNLVLEEVGGMLAPKAIPFTEESMKLVSHIGTLLDGEITNEELKKDIDGINVDFSYVRRLSNKNKGLKIPFIIFNFRDAHNIAFPINLIQTPMDLTSEALKVLNNDKLSESRRANAFNSILLENGLDIEDLGISPLQSFEEQEMQINESLSLIKEMNEKIEVDSMTAIDLVNKATINVDITDKPFISPKVMLDLEEATIKGVEGEEEINILDIISPVDEDELDC